MPCLEKFSKKSFRALSSRNRTEGVWSDEEVDVPERRGFWDGVDFCLGAMMQLSEKRERERERERDVEKHQTNQYIER